MIKTLTNLTLPSLSPDWNDFERYMRSLSHSEGSIKGYKHKVKMFFLSNPDALNYNYVHMLTYFEEVQKVFSNASTKDSLLMSIKKYYDYLVERGIRDDHPCKNFNFKKRINKAFVSNDIFTNAELESMLNREERFEKLRKRNRALISVLIYQGLTSGEICELKVRHIDLESGKIYSPGSRMLSRRYLEIYPSQREILEEYLESRDEMLQGKKEDSLFIGYSFSPIKIEDVSYLTSTFKGLFPDRDLQPKSIRNSVIFNLLNVRRIPLEQVQLFAGHKWISSTARYIQSSFEYERELLNCLW